jgi:hypothetical protein
MVHQRHNKIKRFERQIKISLFEAFSSKIGKPMNFIKKETM